MDCSVRVGTAPEGTNEPVDLTSGDLWHGCYVSAAEPQRGTRVLQDWCVQWAEAGYGFCYFHPRGPEPRELLARLPAERLEDVVWIDNQRTNRPAELDIPEDQRVMVDPLAGPEPGILPKFLETDPIAGRVADWINATLQGDQDVNWNLTRVASVVLPQLIEGDEPTWADITSALTSAKLHETAEPLLEHLEGPAARTQIKHAAENEPRVFRQLNTMLGEPYDPYPSNPHLGEATYSFERARSKRHIVLVTGDAGPPDKKSPHNPGSHLMMQTVLRRLWEEAQSTSDTSPAFPIVLDGAQELTAGDGKLVEEICRNCNQTPAIPVLRGPLEDDLPREMHQFISPHIESRVICKDQGIGGVDAAFKTGDLDAVEQALKTESNHALDPGIHYWVTTGNEGMLAADPREKIDSQIAIPNDPPPTRHGIERVSEAITESVNKFGDTR